MANDPHLNVEIPAVWYEAGVISPDYEARGLTLAGLPLVAIGRARHVAWGITVHPADDQDWFLERLDGGDPPRVQDGWEADSSGLPVPRWIPVARRIETIGVRGAPPETRPIDSTPRGVIEDRGAGGEPALALRTASATAHGSFGILIGLARARDAGEFVRTLEPYDDTPLCVTFGDDGGRAGLQVIGFVPVRARGDGSIPTEGWTGGEPWIGRVPFEGMISVRPDAAPADRPLVAANDRILPPGVDDVYPGDWVAPARAERIARLLGSRPAWSLSDLEAVQTDVLSRRADRTIPAIEAILSAAPGPLPAGATSALEVLRGWDRRMSPTGPSRLWAEVLPALEDQLGGEESGFDSTTLSALLVREAASNCAAAARGAACGFDWFDDPRTPAREGARDRLAAALDAAWTRTTSAGGAVPSAWNWARDHTLTFEHPLAGPARLGHWLNLGPVGMPGGNDTVNVQIAPLQADGPIRPIIHIPSARVLFDLADPDRAFSVLPTGQSGHPLSAHYGDQLSLWAAGGYHAAPFTQAAASAAAVETLLLSPY